MFYTINTHVCLNIRNNKSSIWERQ
jgi:hypothetical protein